MRTRIAICLSAALLIAGAGITVWGDVPTSMNVQGQLTDSGGQPVAPGAKTFCFAIFDAQTNGTKTWPPAVDCEQQPVEIKAAGLWNAHIGAVIPLTADVFADTAHWLEIKVDGEALSRIKLNTNPFSYRAASSQTADTWVEHTVYADTAGYARKVAYDSTGGWYDQGTVVRLGTSTDRVGIGTDNPLYDLDVADDARIQDDFRVDEDFYDYGSVYIIDPGDPIVTGYRLRVHGKAYAESLVVGMYNSGWLAISPGPGNALVWTHGLQGDPEKYVVIVDGKSAHNNRVHQANLGTNQIGVGLYIGLEWYNLSSTQITLERGNADEMGSQKDWDYVRVRIIKNQ